MLARTVVRRKWLVLITLCSLLSLTYVSYDLVYHRDRWVKSDSASSLDSQQDFYSDPIVNSTDNEPRILLVSALFPLPKSKHPLSSYSTWLSNFLTLTSPIYLFIPPALQSLLPSPLPPNVRINTSYESIWDIPIVHPLQHEYSHAQVAKDREKERHGAELYAVWNAKPWLVVEGMNAGGEWDYVFWTDAGSFRYEHRYSVWPAPERVKAVWEEVGGGAGDGKVFFPIFDMPKKEDRAWKEDDGPLDEDFSEGSFFGGSPSSLLWYKSAFYTYHDHYLAQGHFIGKDQSLINALLLLFPSRFIGVWYDDPLSPSTLGPSGPWDHKFWRALQRKWFSRFAASTVLGTCGEEWYYYQFFLGRREEREWMGKVWREEQAGWWWWTFGTVGSERWERCRLTRPVRVGDALRRESVFGAEWAPSPSSSSISLL